MSQNEETEGKYKTQESSTDYFEPVQFLRIPMGSHQCDNAHVKQFCKGTNLRSVLLLFVLLTSVILLFHVLAQILIPQGYDARLTTISREQSSRDSVDRAERPGCWGELRGCGCEFLLLLLPTAYGQQNCKHPTGLIQTLLS